MTPPRRRARGVIAAMVLLLLAAGFVALGIWQLERRAWKHALVAAVGERIHAAPVAAPETADAAHDAYRRVRASGRWLGGRDVLVRAVSDLGAGYWVMSPLDTGGFVLMVNRGFVLQDERGAVRPAEGAATVTGLIRMSEPGGGFLRSNDPAEDRWYSRDLAAIARARGLGRVAPYFVDADAVPGAGGYPVGGLTVVRFPDNHLGYALTWFALAGLSIAGLWRLGREGRQHAGPAVVAG